MAAHAAATPGFSYSYGRRIANVVSHPQPVAPEVEPRQQDADFRERDLQNSEPQTEAPPVNNGEFTKSISIRVDEKSLRSLKCCFECYEKCGRIPTEQNNFTCRVDLAHTTSDFDNPIMPVELIAKRTIRSLAESLEKSENRNFLYRQKCASFSNVIQKQKTSPESTPTPIPTKPSCLRCLEKGLFQLRECEIPMIALRLGHTKISQEIDVEDRSYKQHFSATVMQWDDSSKSFLTRTSAGDCFEISHARMMQILLKNIQNGRCTLSSLTPLTCDSHFLTLTEEKLASSVSSSPTPDPMMLRQMKEKQFSVPTVGIEDSEAHGITVMESEENPLDHKPTQFPHQSPAQAAHLFNLAQELQPWSNGITWDERLKAWRTKFYKESGEPSTALISASIHGSVEAAYRRSVALRRQSICQLLNKDACKLPLIPGILWDSILGKFIVKYGRRTTVFVVGGIGLKAAFMKSIDWLNEQKAAANDILIQISEKEVHGILTAKDPPSCPHTLDGEKKQPQRLRHFGVPQKSPMTRERSESPRVFSFPSGHSKRIACSRPAPEKQKKDAYPEAMLNEKHLEAMELRPYVPGVIWARTTARFFAIYKDPLTKKKRFKTCDPKRYESVAKAYEAAADWLRVYEAWGSGLAQTAVPDCQMEYSENVSDDEDEDEEKLDSESLSDVSDIEEDDEVEKENICHTRSVFSDVEMEQSSPMEEILIEEQEEEIVTKDEIKNELFSQESHEDDEEEEQQQQQTEEEDHEDSTDNQIVMKDSPDISTLLAQENLLLPSPNAPYSSDPVEALVQMEADLEQLPGHPSVRWQKSKKGFCAYHSGKSKWFSAYSRGVRKAYYLALIWLNDIRRKDGTDVPGGKITSSQKDTQVTPQTIVSPPSEKENVTPPPDKGVGSQDHKDPLIGFQEYFHANYDSNDEDDSTDLQAKKMPHVYGICWVPQKQSFSVFYAKVKGESKTTKAFNPVFYKGCKRAFRAAWEFAIQRNNEDGSEMIGLVRSKKKRADGVVSCLSSSSSSSGKRTNCVKRKLTMEPNAAAESLKPWPPGIEWQPESHVWKVVIEEDDIIVKPSHYNNCVRKSFKRAKRLLHEKEVKKIPNAFLHDENDDTHFQSPDSAEMDARAKAIETEEWIKWDPKRKAWEALIGGSYQQFRVGRKGTVEETYNYAVTKKFEFDLNGPASEDDSETEEQKKNKCLRSSLESAASGVSSARKRQKPSLPESEDIPSLLLEQEFELKREYENENMF